MPPAMKYDGNAAPPAFVEYQQDAGPITIAEGTGIRVRIRGIRAEKGQMYAIATINDVSESTRAMRETAANGCVNTGFSRVWHYVVALAPQTNREFSVIDSNEDS